MTRRTPFPTRSGDTSASPAARDGELRQLATSELMATRAADGDAAAGRVLEGIAVPYGVDVLGPTREYGRARERFAPGAFDDAIAAVRDGGRIPILDTHGERGGTVVGYADELWDAPDGLHYRGTTIDVPEASPFVRRVAARVIHASIEFLPGRVRRVGDVVEHVRVAALGAIAGAYHPAYQGASISVRSSGGSNMRYCEHCGAQLDGDALCACPAAVATRAAAGDAAARQLAERAATAAPVALSPDAIAELARGAAEETYRRLAERGSAGRAPDPLALFREYRSLGALMLAAADPAADRELTRYAARALADQLTTDNNAGVTTPGVLADVHGIVSRGRRAITAFGGPRPLGGSGMSVDWPYFDGTLTSLVGAQATQKSEITSAKVEIKKGTEPIQTFAGGSDVAYQLIRRSQPAYLDIYGRILLTAWGVVTDAAFVTELETGSVTQDFGEALSAVDAAEMKNHIIDASITVETATGVPAEFVLASTTAFTAVAKLFTPVTSQPAQASVGVTDIAGLRVNVGNLPVIHVPSITAGKLIVSNREAAGWFEDGPFQATEEDVAKLGRNVAYWSMGAPARFVPGGIVEVYDVSP